MLMLVTVMIIECHFHTWMIHFCNDAINYELVSILVSLSHSIYYGLSVGYKFPEKVWVVRPFGALVPQLAQGLSGHLVYYTPNPVRDIQCTTYPIQ